MHCRRGTDVGGDGFRTAPIDVWRITFFFLGEMPQEKILEEMRGADVFLHSAVSEGFCNAVIEAQSMGLPVVCSDAGGLPENVSDGKTGYVVPRRQPAALAEKLALLSSDPQFKDFRWGRPARERVLKLFCFAGSKSTLSTGFIKRRYDLPRKKCRLTQMTMTTLK